MQIRLPGLLSAPLFGLLLSVSLIQSADAQDTEAYQWTWVGGSNTASNNPQPGVYGKLGTLAEFNMPGSREGSSSWTDSSGNLWLFGGCGVDANGNLGLLNDLWEFDPGANAWAWMGGSSTIGSNPSGVFAAQVKMESSTTAALQFPEA
ncbi:MAG: kelch repeat-containing protein [Terracidiphilus sp.]